MAAKRPKAPAGCYWRANTLWGRTFINGREVRWSLQTDNSKIAAERRKAGKERAIADVHGDATRDFVEVMESWSDWIKKEVSPKTVKRYACSLDQLMPFLDSKQLNAVDGRLVSEIVRVRSLAGVSNATIKRDLVALSSVINYSIDQGWRDDNPVLPRLRRIKERRDPIVLPQRAHIDLVISRCPGMVADVVRAAMATGAREDELLRARRDTIDHDRRQMTITGKRNKQRVIELDPFSGYTLLSSLPSYAGKPWLFWHGAGETYKNFASQFAAIVKRTAAWARETGADFRPFRFHDLRHWHAVQWLKEGRSIYDLQHRLGHSSIKTTEMYCEYLTPDEQRVSKQQTGTKTGTPTAGNRAVEAPETLVLSG
jgi:integrase/recombinase XerD